MKASIANPSSAATVAAAPPSTTLTPGAGGLDWALASVSIDARPAEVFSTLFGEGSQAFWTKAYAEDKRTGVSFSGWAWAADGATQTVEYILPKKGLQGKTKVVEHQRVLTAGPAAGPAAGRPIEVEVVAQTPGVPYGKSFESVVRYTIGPVDGGRTVVAVVGGVAWHKKCVLRKTINKKIESSMRKTVGELTATRLPAAVTVSG